MQILIIRHGNPDYANDTLTEKGWREAHLLAERIARLEVRDFYVSPLGRARDTAAPTLERMGRQAEILPWLTEFRGRLLDPDKGHERNSWDLRPQYWTRCNELFDRERWVENPCIRTGSAEAVYRETQAGIEQLLSRYGYERQGMLYRTRRNTQDVIVIFCHLALGLAVLGHMLGVSPVVMQHAFFLPTSSVTTLVTEEREKGEVYFKCMQLGDTSHLYAHGEPVSRAGLFPEVYAPRP